MTRLALLCALLALPTLAVAAPETESVTMSLQEFLKLYEQGRTPPDPVEEPPRHFAISSARYEGSVVLRDGEPISAVFRGRQRVEVLKPDGWVRVPLLPADVALRSARVGGKEANIVPDGSWMVLVTDRKGAFDVELDFAVAVQTKEGRSSLQFTLAPSGATTAKLSVPSEALLDFVVANAKLTELGGRADLRVVEAVLPGSGSLSVSWQRALDDATPEEVAEPARVHAELHTLASLGDGLLAARTAATWTLLRGKASRFRVRVPEGTTVVGVEGKALRDWRVQDGVLDMELNYEEETEWSAILHLERLLEAGGSELRIPVPEPLDVDRAKGYVGVEARGTLELTALPTDDAALLDVRLLPAAILGVTDSPVLLGWKYLGTTATLPLRLTEHEDVAVLVTLLDEARATTMFTADGRRLTSVRYRVRNNRKQFLRLALPSGAELWSASVAGKAVQPAAAADGRILLPLVRSQAGGGALADFEVSVVYVESGDAPVRGRGSFWAALPTADVPITYVAWSVWAPEQAKVGKRSKDGSLRPVDGLSQPFSAGDRRAMTETNQLAQTTVQAGARGQVAGGGLGEGAAPVEVSVPLEGRPHHFEKLLALGEELWVGFDYRGLK